MKSVCIEKTNVDWMGGDGWYLRYFLSSEVIRNFEITEVLETLIIGQ